VRIVDLNLILYAVNADSAHHAAALAWWNKVLGDDETIGLPWIVLLGFLRIATNPRIFPNPLRSDAAISKVDGWLARDNVRITREKEDHWEVLRGLLAGAGTAGNLTTDAHLAALAVSHDATLVSSDADFGRFKGLRWENPLA
jgi:toxin-antitoxin system PIN domain toxin